MGIKKKFSTPLVFDFWQYLLRKLPPGIIWLQQGIVSGATYLDGLPVPMTYLGKILMGLADDIHWLNRRIERLADEANPQTTDELLSEWEESLNLPEFGYEPATDDERRLIAAAKLSLKGGQSAEYYEYLAERYGYIVDVYDGPFSHWWTVKSDQIERFRCNSICNDALVSFTAGFQRVSRALWHYKPAHTGIFWTN